MVFKGRMTTSGQEESERDLWKPHLKKYEVPKLLNLATDIHIAVPLMILPLWEASGHSLASKEYGKEGHAEGDL